MKILVRLLLFIILIAFATPSVIDILDYDQEISLKIVDENDKTKEEKELKIEFIIIDSKMHLTFNQFASNKVSNEYLIKEYSTFTSINIIPPKV